MSSALDALAPRGAVDITVIEDKSNGWYSGRQTCGQPACEPKPVCVKPCPKPCPPEPVCVQVTQTVCEVPPPPVKTCETTRTVSTETTVCCTEDPCASGSGKNYTALFWAIWLFVAPLTIYIILLSFPGRFVLVQDPVSGQCVIDYRRLFGISIITGWLLILVLWIASWACY